MDVKDFIVLKKAKKQGRNRNDLVFLYVFIC